MSLPQSGQKGRWTPQEVREYLDRYGYGHIIDELYDAGYRIKSYDRMVTTYIENGEIKSREVPANGSHSDSTIRIRANLSVKEAASVLFHEYLHFKIEIYQRDDPESWLKEEEEVRYREELFRIDVSKKAAELGRVEDMLGPKIAGGRRNGIPDRNTIHDYVEKKYRPFLEWTRKMHPKSDYIPDDDISRKEWGK